MADQEKSSEDVENKEDTGDSHETEDSRTDTEAEESHSESELTIEAPDESDGEIALDASEADTDEASEVENPDSEEQQVEDAGLADRADELDAFETEESADASEDADIEDAEILDAEEVESEAEDATEPPEIEQPAPPPPPPPQPAQGPSAFGLVFGGLLAGAIGFAVATFAVPEGWPSQQAGGDVEALEAEVARLSEAVEAMRSDPAIGAEVERLSQAVEALEMAPAASGGEAVAVDLSPVTEAIAGLQALTGSMESAAADLGARLDQVDTAMTDSLARIEALEARPVVEEPDGSAAMEAQLEAFRSELDTVTEEARLKIEDAQNRASEIEQAAADAAATASRQAAISELNAALESGAAFSDPLSRIADAPEGLSSHAETGVPTMAELREEFPDAARAALQATQTVPTDASATDRLTAFLRRQTNARSLSPQEGDSVDAILSRAEAALTGGDLETALSETASLSEDASAAMNGWIAGASARQKAVSAAAKLN